MQDTNVQTESTTNSTTNQIINPLFENNEPEFILSYSDSYLKKFRLILNKLEYQIYRSIEVPKNWIGERYKFTNSDSDIDLFNKNYNVINILKELYDISRSFKKIRIYELVETIITYFHHIDWVSVIRDDEFIDQSDSEIRRLEINLLRRMSRIFIFMNGGINNISNDCIILCTKIFSSLKMFDEFKHEYNKKNNIEEIQIKDIIKKTNIDLSCVAHMIFDYIKQDDSFSDRIIEAIIMNNELFFNSSKDRIDIDIKIKIDLISIFGLKDIYFETSDSKNFFRIKNFDLVYDILFENFILKFYSKYIDHFKRY